MNIVKSTALAAVTAISLAPALAFAQEQDGLVNVAVANNTVQVPIDLAVQLCPNVDVNVLAEQFDGSDEVVCRIDQQTAAENGLADSPGAKDGRGRQEGLVNIRVEDNTVQVPIGIAAQVCPNLDANVLAQQEDGDEAVMCEITQDVAAENGIGQ